MVGGPWLYFKLYIGPKSGDELLEDEIYYFTNRLIEKEAILSFFFIRYADPDFHIRLRLQIKNGFVLSEILSDFYNIFNPLVENMHISNITVDTYNREIERYGANTIQTAEDIFFFDSECILKILRLLYETEEERREILRWQLSLLLIDDILNAFEFDNNSKLSFFTELSGNFKTEFGFNSNRYTRQLNEKYRESKVAINEIMSRASECTMPYINHLAIRESKISRCVSDILFFLEGNESHISLNQFLNSIIHMTMNRICKSKNRLHELIIYDFLQRYYASICAKIKYMNL